MLYQLPNGKVVNLSLEEYLSLTDQDIQSLMASNYGDYATSPWVDSAIKKSRKKKEPKDIDKSIDYTEESDEIIIHSTTLSLIIIDDINLSSEIEDEDSEESQDT